MIDHLNFLQKARRIFINILQGRIIKDEINESICQLKIMLDSGMVIYIRYNQFGEYGYQIIHSRKKNDFSRFDNYDDRWKVKTRLHHYHIKGGHEVKSSPMSGNPEKDMLILAKYTN